MSAGSADTIAFTRSYSPALIASMNAAALSGMDGLYLRSKSATVGSRVCCVSFVSFVSFVFFVVFVVPARPAAAQSKPDRGERPPIGSTLTADALADLPSGGSLFTLLDTVVPEVITDRVDTGGAFTGNPLPVGRDRRPWAAARV